MRRSQTFIFIGCTSIFLLSTPLFSGGTCTKSNPSNRGGFSHFPSCSSQSPTEEETAYEESTYEDEGELNEESAPERSDGTLESSQAIN
jgi:hypothetical protein